MLKSVDSAIDVFVMLAELKIHLYAMNSWPVYLDANTLWFYWLHTLRRILFCFVFVIENKKVYSMTERMYGLPNKKTMTETLWWWEKGSFSVSKLVICILYPA